MAKNKKGKYSKFIVTFIVVANVLFTREVLRVFLQTSSEPTVLIGSWFAFTTVELWQLAGIKKKNIEKENTNNG